MTFDYIRYWEKHYKNGGTSGQWSYGPLAIFKAEVINGVIERYGIQRVMEFGCGDCLSRTRYFIDGGAAVRREV